LQHAHAPHAHPLLGGVASMLPAPYNAGADAFNVNDYCMEATSAGAVTGGCALAHTNCSTDINPTKSVTVTFAPQLPLFPRAQPQAVGSVYFLNRGDGGLGSRITAGGGYLSLDLANGSALATYPLYANLVTQTQVAPITYSSPPAADATEWQKQNLVRYVYLQTSGIADSFLHLKELMVLDDTDTNVALNQLVTGTPQYLGDATPYYLSMATDGVVDRDASPLNMCHSISIGAWLQVDLASMRNVTRVELAWLEEERPLGGKTL
jgi:hypothetical protein